MRIRLSDPISDLGGAPVEGAEVTVVYNGYNGDEDTNVFADRTGSDTLAQPLLTNERGYIDGFVEEGTYKFIVDYGPQSWEIFFERGVGPITPEAFGADGRMLDRVIVEGLGAIDDKDALQASANEAAIRGKPWYLPGTYYSSTSIWMPAPSPMIYGDLGGGSPQTNPAWPYYTGDALENYPKPFSSIWFAPGQHGLLVGFATGGGSGGYIKDLGLYCNNAGVVPAPGSGSSQLGKSGLILANTRWMSVERVEVRDFDICFDMQENCYGTSFYQIWSGRGNVPVLIREGASSGDDIKFFNPWLSGYYGAMWVVGDATTVYGGQLSALAGLASNPNRDLYGQVNIGVNYLTGATPGTGTFHTVGTSFEGHGEAWFIRTYGNISHLRFDMPNFLSHDGVLGLIKMTDPGNAQVVFNQPRYRGTWDCNRADVVKKDGSVGSAFRMSEQFPYPLGLTFNDGAWGGGFLGGGTAHATTELNWFDHRTFMQAGAMKVVGGNGTVTTIANA